MKKVSFRSRVFPTLRSKCLSAIRKSWAQAWSCWEGTARLESVAGRTHDSKKRCLSTSKSKMTESKRWALWQWSCTRQKCRRETTGKKSSVTKPFKRWGPWTTVVSWYGMISAVVRNGSGDSSREECCGSDRPKKRCSLPLAKWSLGTCQILTIPCNGH